MTFDAWSIAGVLLVIMVAAWGIRILKGRLDDQRYREQLADLEFEHTLLNATPHASAANNDSVFLQVESSATPAPNPSYYPGPDSLAENSLSSSSISANSSETQSADLAIKAVLVKLQQAGIANGVEGYIDVHGNSKGAALVRLRSGKLAMIVPHMESEAFLRKNSRRADLTIMMGTDGSAFVVRPLEDFVADSITLM